MGQTGSTSGRADSCSATMGFIMANPLAPSVCTRPARKRGSPGGSSFRIQGRRPFMKRNTKGCPPDSARTST